MSMNMNKLAVKSKLAFGAFVTIVSVFNVGCANYSPVMSSHLDSFQIDCRIKEQQVRFLQSMRNTNNEKFNARATNAVMPWTMITDSSNYQHRQGVQTGYNDWVINQLLLRLGYDCP